jgi:hypothetical protein
MRPLFRLIGRFVGRPLGRAGSRLGDAGWSRGTRGSGVWLAVGLIVGGFRFMGRLGTRKREVLLSRELAPGEALRITHLLEDRKGRAVKP